MRNKNQIIAFSTWKIIKVNFRPISNFIIENYCVRIFIICIFQVNLSFSLKFGDGLFFRKKKHAPPSPLFPKKCYMSNPLVSFSIFNLKWFTSIMYTLLYSYNFNPIKNTHLRHVTVHYFSVLYNRKPYFSRIGRPDKSVFFSYCTLCKGSNSLILQSN
jgi:hypothetical protein